MKLGVFFDSGIKGIEAVEYIIDWNYPYYPQKGDYIRNPERFFDQELCDFFRSQKLRDYFEINPKDEKTLLEYFMEPGELYYVHELEWSYNEKFNIDYPSIWIALKNK
jgi:hypothetical protein